MVKTKFMFGNYWSLW